MPSPVAILSPAYRASTCGTSVQNLICLMHKRTMHARLTGSGDGILPKLLLTRLMMPTSPGVGVVGTRLNLHAPGRLICQVLFVNPLPTSRVCASSLRRVSALRGTLNSRTPVSSLRPQVRSMAHRGLRSLPAKSSVPWRADDTSTIARVERLRARTACRWAVTRIFRWEAGIHIPVRRVFVAGGRMFGFIV